MEVKMPTKINKLSLEKSQLFNFYIDRDTKDEFAESLRRMGYEGQVSAALRTLINLFVTDSDIRNRVSADICNHIVYRKSGKESKL